MKKKIFILLIISLLVVCGCEKEKANVSSNTWDKNTFFAKLPVPNGEVVRNFQEEKHGNHEKWQVLVKNTSYDDFYNYIMALEDKGYNYEFVKENVPKDINKLVDINESSWMANNGNIYIIANWYSDSNSQYNGYNLQLIFYNYNYLTR